MDRLAELVALARDGDRAAFENLVTATSGECYALALRLVGNEHDASDVLQESYLRAFRSMRRFRGEAAFQTWLHRIVVNCSISFVDRRRRHDHAALDDGLDVVETRPERDPELAATSGDDRDRILDALDALPHCLRVVVVLRDVYDLPHEAIARELGISQTASKVRLHRARRRLRDQLFPVTVRERPPGDGADGSGVVVGLHSRPISDGSSVSGMRRDVC